MFGLSELSAFTMLVYCEIQCNGDRGVIHHDHIYNVCINPNTFSFLLRIQ